MQAQLGNGDQPSRDRAVRHIVPLARFGANDVTNLQLLCEPCNLKKAAGLQPVSPFYPEHSDPE
ncbi:HNH endonuclease [Rhizobium sp. BT03]|uniref:HNH endonuclease n=1 Tax=Rhizobium sp. BT03 TaxID=3045156 RepID=UPI0034E95248